MQPSQQIQDLQPSVRHLHPLHMVSLSHPCEPNVITDYHLHRKSTHHGITPLYGIHWMEALAGSLVKSLGFDVWPWWEEYVLKPPLYIRSVRVLIPELHCGLKIFLRSLCAIQASSIVGGGWNLPIHELSALGHLVQLQGLRMFCPYIQALMVHLGWGLCYGMRRRGDLRQIASGS